MSSPRPKPSKVPSRGRFVRRLKRALRVAGVTHPLRLDPEAFALRVGDDEVFYLDNLYRSYCDADPWRRLDILGHAASLHDPAALFLPFEEALPRLLPRVRERGYYASLELEARSDGRRPAAFVRLPIGEELSAGLVYTTANGAGLVEVSEQILERWGVRSSEALFAAACNNLRAMSEGAFASGHPGLYISTWRDGHDASRILLPELFERLDLQGAPVAMVPNRDVLLVAGSDDPEALSWSARAAERCWDAPHPKSLVAYRRAADGWHAFLPPATDPELRRAFRRLRYLDRGREYNLQAPLLGRLEEDEEVRIGEFAVVEIDPQAVRDMPPDGDLVSTCVWVDGEETLLPRVDWVCLASREPSGQRVPWRVVPFDDLRALLGVEPLPGVHPQRYRVKAFPDLDQLTHVGLPWAA